MIQFSSLSLFLIAFPVLFSISTIYPTNIVYKILRKIAFVKTVYWISSILKRQKKVWIELNFIICSQNEKLRTLQNARKYLRQLYHRNCINKSCSYSQKNLGKQRLKFYQDCESSACDQKNLCEIHCLAIIRPVKWQLHKKTKINKVFCSKNSSVDEFQPHKLAPKIRWLLEFFKNSSRIPLPSTPLTKF